MTTTTLPTQEQVDRVAAELAPDVIYARLNIATDWADYPAMYFKVLIADGASRGARLREVVEKVRMKFTSELGLDSFEHMPYFNFRNESEQAKLKEPAWD